MDFSTALKEVMLLQQEEHDDVVEECVTQLYAHGKKTDSVIVYFHGFTNCPYQFSALAQMLHKEGHTVLVPRIPFHGYKDKMTTALRDLNDKKLTDFIDKILNIASGLGKDVTVIGLSGGGVMALYAAMNYPLYKVISIAPALSFPLLPWSIQGPFMWATKPLSSLYIYWSDYSSKSKAYPRFPLRALRSFFEIGTRILSNTTPKSKAFILVTNENDPTTHHRAVEILENTWKPVLGPAYKHVIIPRKLHLPHDFIDPSSKKYEQHKKHGYPYIITEAHHQ